MAKCNEYVREIEANARLIAAAPELLTACQSALALIRNRFPFEHGSEEIGKAWGLLESAIKKATEL